MKEKLLKDNILESLQGKFPTWEIADFPIDINQYVDSKFTSPIGAILIKPLGVMPIYVMENTSISPFVFQDFINMTYRWNVVILARKMDTMDEMLDMTDEIISFLSLIEIPDNCGQLKIESISEPQYDTDLLIFMRTITFSQLSIEYVGE